MDVTARTLVPEGIRMTNTTTISDRRRRLVRVVAVWAVVALFGMGTPRATAAELSTGPVDLSVARAQAALAEAGFYRGEIDGRSGPMTRASVLAFEKAAGLDRDAVWQMVDHRRLATFEPTYPERANEPDRVEIDITNQVGYLIKNGRLVGTFGISSGNGKAYAHPNGYTGVAKTPRGDFQFYRHIDGVRRAPLGTLYRPWYFRGGFAIHGSGSVPAYPASHGCVRVTNWDADWLADHLELGMPVHIWDGEPIEAAALEYSVPAWTVRGSHPI